MRAKIGGVFMALGLVFLLGAVCLLLWNQREAQQAATASAEVMPKISDAILQNAATDSDVIPTEQNGPVVPTEPEQRVMETVHIEGYDYIGYLSVPSLGLNLPVMDKWSEAGAEIAPCRFYGTTFDGNLVVAGHNYSRHFGSLDELKADDEVLFVDMTGESTLYRVVAIDVVPPNSVEEVASGAYDLALVTCTYGGKTRLVVYCDCTDSNSLRMP